MADAGFVAAATVVCCLLRRRKKIRQRKTREKEWLKRRKDMGAFREIIQELRLEDEGNYRRYLRMDATTFEDLLHKITPLIKKKDTNMREAIPPEERLAVTLRFLATGESFSSLQYQYRISQPTLSTIIIPEVCEAIYKVLKDHFKCPNTPQEWLSVAKLFEERWQLPNCIGAADGKHVRILHPKNSGSEFYNYKGYYSIVLMAVVDADYKFTFADVGCQGRISDGGVLKNSQFWKTLAAGALGLPEPSLLPQSMDQSFEGAESVEPVPYFLAGDEAFPLEVNIMKPYPQRNLSEEKRVFNYRISRARRVSENVFGILASRFRVFHSTLCVHPESAIKIVLSAIALHNFLRSKSPGCYIPQGSVDTEELSDGSVKEGTWRQEIKDNPFTPFPNSRKGRQPRRAEAIRDQLCQYVNGPGQVPWQWKCLL